jgi:hypothetical protein
MKARLSGHPQGDTRQVSFGGGELLDASLDHFERKLVELAQSAGVGTRERRHRGPRIRFDEARLAVRACMKVPQAEHPLVLVTKGAQVGESQRC